MAGGVFELGNPEGRGGEAQAVLEIQVEAGVKKPCLPSGGGGWCGFFSDITQFRE